MKKSFTLIEILVVSTIIGLLSAAAFVSFTQFSKQSRDARRKTDIEQVRAALEMYRSNNNTYPANLSVLTSGVIYLQSVPVDPQSSSYSYYYSGSASDFTLGAHLETDSVTCQALSAQCGGTSGGCTYCAGPYGEK